MKSFDMQKKARALIPGGTQLLSKRPEMFAPDVWPGYYDKAEGAYIWDLDGNKYLDMSIAGIGANVLGYCDPDVNQAVVECIGKGNSTSLNCPEEVELAELLVDLHPWASKVRYARTGGEAMAVAVRIARAYSGKDVVAFCGYHGWHDWYLSSNLKNDDSLVDHLLPGLYPKGVPRGLINTSIPFKYNDISEFEALIAKHGESLGAVVMEPMRNDYPKDNYLQKIRQYCDDLKIPLVFDEITAGFRNNCGGIHLNLGVVPDIAVFGKAISNGYPMAAIIGKGDIMDVAQSTFISSTYWTERIGPVAALATIKKFKECKVYEHINEIGKSVQNVWKRCADKHGIEIEVGGIFPLSHFHFRHPEGQKLMTVFVQKMLGFGILASNRFYAMYSHTMSNVETYEQAVDKIFVELKLAIKAGKIDDLLVGPVSHTGFRRLN